MVQLLESTCQLPADWPKAGAIDLAVHDLPHASSTIEWWYVNSHLKAADGREFSLFASFFRLAIGRDQQLESFQYAYSLTWAICDVEQQKYQLDSLVDQSAPQIGLQMIKEGGEGSDPLLQKALREVFEKGNVPLPDRLLRKEPKVSLTSLDLDLDSNQFVRLEDGTYKLALIHSEQQISCELYFKPETAVVRHGDQGVVRGTAHENMFYYFIPKCRVEGSLTLEDDSFSVEGSGWYDHEFGKPTAEQPAGHIKHDIAWNWLSIQLSNGYQVSVYDLFDSADLAKNCGRWAIVIDPQGKACHYQDFLFQPLTNWTSTRTFHTYPVEWRLEIPEAEISLIIKAEFPAQEFVTILSKPAFWEGRIRGEGTFRQNGATAWKK
ncbi:MAG: lipocalin-like domain-containing protein [Cyanobacteria bacterium J06659_2]